MKIATWNIERPHKGSKRLFQIEQVLREMQADILVLTETCINIDPGLQYEIYHSAKAHEPYYKLGERRVSIYSQYPVIAAIPTYQPETSLCILLDTPGAPLAVYGTVIGKTGNRDPDFKQDLIQQAADYRRISALHNLCIAGDFNMSFSDNYYYTKWGRQFLKEVFKELSMVNSTADIPQNIDHIVISRDIGGLLMCTETWNHSKQLSDHIGVISHFYTL